MHREGRGRRTNKNKAGQTTWGEPPLSKEPDYQLPRIQPTAPQSKADDLQKSKSCDANRPSRILPCARHDTTNGGFHRLLREIRIDLLSQGWMRRQLYSFWKVIGIVVLGQQHFFPSGSASSCIPGRLGGQPIVWFVLALDRSGLLNLERPSCLANLESNTLGRCLTS